MRNVNLALGLAVVISAGATSMKTAAAEPLIIPYNPHLFAEAGIITKAQAIAIALQAVGGGKVVSAQFEREDHNSHWTVDIIGAQYEYEVWVSPSGQVIKIITSPK